MRCKLVSKSAYDLINKCIMVITSVSMIPQNHVASKFVQYSCGCFISSLSISPKGKKFSSNLHHVGIRAVSREIPFMQKKFSIKKQSIQDIISCREIDLQLIPNNDPSNDTEISQIFFFLPFSSHNFPKFFSELFFPPPTFLPHVSLAGSL